MKRINLILFTYFVSLIVILSGLYTQNIWMTFYAALMTIVCSTSFDLPNKYKQEDVL